MSSIPYVYLYDTTLRDGLQTAGLSATLSQKQAYMKMIQPYHFDFQEIGMVGDLHDKELSLSRYSRGWFLCLPTPYYITLATRLGISRLQFVIKADTDHILHVIRKEPYQYIFDCITVIKQRKIHHTICALEHFFDGYKKNKQFALNIITQLSPCCSWIVLADTNGGTLSHEIKDILEAVRTVIPLSRIGIHAHNDIDLAVSNSITAVQTGVRMVQGTWNGMGERCGNANLISVACTLQLKVKYTTCLSSRMNTLTDTSDKIISLFGNRVIDHYYAYVGKYAFTHKAGLHIQAVQKNSSLYEHISPSLVGNKNKMLFSESISRASLVSILGIVPDVLFLPIAKQIIHSTPVNKHTRKIKEAYQLFLNQNKNK